LNDKDHKGHSPLFIT